MEYIDHYLSPIGDITVSVNEDSLTGAWFQGQKYYPEFRGEHMFMHGPYHDDVFSWLDYYFLGKNPLPSLLKLSMSGSSFQMAVWNELLRIPYGSTVTYGELAERIARHMGKNSMSAQAIGGAVGRNRISVIVPCHRVIGADGALTGYAGGLSRKEWLLKHEGGLI